MTIKALRLIAFAGCILALIGGCAPTTDTVRAPAINTIDAPDISVLEKAAEMLLEAELSEQSDSLILTAAGLIANAGDIAQSTDVLARINADNLSDTQFIEYSLLGIELDLILANWARAAAWFETDRFIFLSATFDRELRLRTLSLKSDANFALGNFEQSLITSIQLARMLTKKSEVREIHNKIWRQLNQLSYAFLQQGQNHQNVRLAGWLQLAELCRKHQSSQQAQIQQFNRWQLRWKTHPAALTPPTPFSKGFKYSAPPAQVALLLPLQEQYEVPSYTLLDGFMGAYYELLAQADGLPADAPRVRIYDTSVQSVQKAYNNAVDDGAAVIVGPMRQSEVAALLTVPELPVPTISLNRTDDSTGLQVTNLFQFGLSPLDEMRQIADRAWQRGQRNIVLIAPDNNWGNRSSEFFNQYWADMGGAVLATVPYPTSVNDFTPLLKAPLQIDLSEERGLQLKRFINSRVQFTARRRQDIDLVVVLGYPVRARQIKPALDFLYASDIPVVATSHIYNGTEQVGLDRDLSGVEFVAMPWTLPGQMPSQLQPDQRLHIAYRHLYAMGYDAFLLHRNLPNLTSERAIPIFGSTGLLSLSDGIIKRQGKWAKFQRGKVSEIQP
ncbi:MAG: penicillin-binding protein activator [Porticoccaceae bacterium]|nr:penicillin-binding protein activator [Porticoccaceae bacterium]